MFNDKYGLTMAVLEGRKTQTRRLITDAMLKEASKNAMTTHDDTSEYLDSLEEYLISLSPYKVDDGVAIAQSYKDLGYTKDLYQTIFLRKPTIFKSIDSLPLQGRVDVPFNELKG